MSSAEPTNITGQQPIFLLMGKSASGKDTVFSLLCLRLGIGTHTDGTHNLDTDGINASRAATSNLLVNSIVSYTTRPIRYGEHDGDEYYFITDEELDALDEAGRIVDLRCYETPYGVWRYAVVRDEQLDGHVSTVMINTPEGANHLRAAYGDRVKTILIHVDDGVRLQRALERERSQEQPKYDEMCRRFLADASDFENAWENADIVVDNVHSNETSIAIANYIEAVVRGEQFNADDYECVLAMPTSEEN